MKTGLLIPLVFLVTSTAQAITIATVPVGNPGNANDNNSVGAVSYNYAIGEFDVTVGQYTSFLNAVAATDTYSLYSTPGMATDLNVAGIARSGSPGSFTYSVIGSANHPISLVLGDFNRDGHVNAADISAMMLALSNPQMYQTTYNISLADLPLLGDINGDGKFNNADLQALLDYLKAGHGSTDPVPEPSTFVLAVLALGLVMARRRLS